ncbi:ParB/RepB/Spo0J family partition protein [Desulfotomaculum copahuensis]|uniref:Stage 0 sporulation protein J n=1 Tax=Desulfotomaculum copahuensis TaxID=1838280 RepID=A0A1B7LAX4_9FIRM|nr:ParB/RepB/Spo0J family partition protein [Desulfotomaculum copahuensis]OAT79478.1 stage 0 sporulation protein J [Desulfotomaculum copahuensis]
MSKKRGLGRGLDALIPVLGNIDDERLEKVKVADVHPNPRQPRQHLDEEKLKELADSIREHGVVQPVVVRPLDEGGYELIAGERRWRACVALQEEFIPAVIRNYNEVEASAISLIENIQREDLNPLEEAMAFRRLMDEYKLTQEDISRVVGKSRPFIANSLRLLSLPPEVKELLYNGRISAGHARALLALDQAADQAAVASDVVAAGMSVRDLEELVRKRIAPDKASSGEEKIKNSAGGDDPDFESMEGMLNGILNSTVRIRRRKGGRGVIEISYNSRAHLDEIINILVQ